MSVERYEFVASGQDTVANAFRTVANSADRSANNIKSAMRGQERAWLAAQRATQQAARAQSRAAEKTAQQQERAAQKAAAAVERAAQKEARAVEKAERQKLAAIRKSAREQVAIESRVRRQAMAEADRLRRRQQRDAMAGRIGMVRGAVMGIAGRAINTITTGAMGLAAAGIYGGVQAVRQGVSLQERAVRVGIAGGVDPTALRKNVQAAALSTPGAKAEDVLAGVERFTAKTGRADLAQQFTKTMAQISMATGTSAEDIGDAMADLFEKFDISTVQEMNRAMATLAVQGKRGSFELRDAAAQFPKVAAAAQRFGLRGSQGLTTLGGLTQIARRATPSAEEAATSVESMFTKLVQNADKVKLHTKTNVFKDRGKTQTNDIVDILVGTIAGARGNQQTLQKIFDVRGIRAVSPLISTFNKTFADTKGTEQEKLAAATAALRAEILSATLATGAEAEVKRDAAKASSTAGARLTAAWEGIVAAVSSDAVLGAVARFAEGIAAIDPSTFAAAVSASTTALTAFINVLDSLGLVEKKKRSSAEAATEAAQHGIASSEAAIEASGVRANILARAKLKAHGKKGPALTPEEMLAQEATPQEQQRLAELAGAESIAASQQSVTQTLEGLFGKKHLSIKGEQAGPFGLVQPTKAATVLPGTSAAAGELSVKAAEAQGGPAGGAFTAALEGQFNALQARLAAANADLDMLAKKAQQASTALGQIKDKGTGGNAAVL